MFGDINVNFTLQKVNYSLGFSYKATFNDFKEMFLRLTLFDPSMFDFYAGKHDLSKYPTIIKAFTKPLSDLTIDVVPKKNVKYLQHKFLVRPENGRKKKLSLNINSKDRKLIKEAVAMYFKLDEEDVHLNVRQDGYVEINSKISSFEANINGSKYEILYSKNASVLDIKYYAAIASSYTCSLFYIDGVEYRNNVLFSSIEKLPGKKEFKKFECPIFFRCSEDNKVQKTILEGAPNGRNVKRAIANALGQNVNGLSEDFLVIDYNGRRIPIDLFSCIDTSLVSESTPFVYGFPISVEVKIISNGNVVESSFNSYDPELTFGQLRRRIAKLFYVDTPEFVVFTDSSDFAPDDSIKLSDVLSDGSALNVSFIAPTEIDPCFTLYNGKTVKQIKVDPEENNQKVRERISEKFRIDPNSVLMWRGSTQLYDPQRFIKNYISSTTYRLAAKLSVEVTYKESVSLFAFPLDVEFDELAKTCSTKYRCPMKAIGFYIKNGDALLPAYEPWEGSLLPGPQYVARHRVADKNNMVKLTMLLNSDEHFDASKVELTVEVFEKGKFVHDSCEICLSETLAHVIKPGRLAVHKDGLDEKSIFVIEGKLEYPSTLISKAFPSKKDCKLTIFPIGTFMYMLPGESEPKYVVMDTGATIGEFKERVSPAGKSFVISHNGQIINEMFQPIQLFDFLIPFMLENDKGNAYNITYRRSETEVTTDQITVNEKMTVSQLEKESLLFLNKQGLKKLTMNQIRLEINSVTVTKEMEGLNLVSQFGPSGDVEVFVLEKFCTTVQGEGLFTIHASPTDTISYVKRIFLKRVDESIKEENIQYYFLIHNSVAADDSNQLKDFMYDDDLCFDIVPIQNTLNVTIVFPDFKHDFRILNDCIMYSIKEFIAPFYNFDDPDMVELVDQANSNVVDDNDSPEDNQVLVVKLSDKSAKVCDEFIDSYNRIKYKTDPQKVKKSKESDSKKSKNGNVQSPIDEPRTAFTCKFVFLEQHFEFSLELFSDTTCNIAKQGVAKCIASHVKHFKNIDYDDLIISIKNEKIANSEVLMPKYLSESSIDPDVKFLVEYRNSF